MGGQRSAEPSGPASEAGGFWPAGPPKPWDGFFAELRLTPEPLPRCSAFSLWLMDSMAAITRVTMKAIPAAVKARSKRGARALPPEAKITTATKAITAQNEIG